MILESSHYPGSSYAYNNPNENFGKIADGHLFGLAAYATPYSNVYNNESVQTVISMLF